MKMDHKVEFQSLWSNHFPNVDTPRLSCFEEKENGETEFQTRVNTCLTESRHKIDELHAQLQKEVFIVDYLENLILSQGSGMNHQNNTQTLDNGNDRIGQKRPSVKMRARMFQSSVSSSDRDSVVSNLSSPGSPVSPVSSLKKGRKGPPPPPRRSKLTSAASLEEAGVLSPRCTSPPKIINIVNDTIKEPTYSEINEPPYHEPADVLGDTSQEPAYCEVADAIKCIDDVLEDNTTLPKSFRIPRGHQYEEVELNMDLNSSERDVEVSVISSVVDAPLTQEEIEKLYTPIDPLTKISKPPALPARQSKFAVPRRRESSEPAYEEIGFANQASSVLQQRELSPINNLSNSTDSIEDVVKGSVTESSEEDDEVLYQNVRELRKQRRMTQTLHEIRKSVSFEGSGNSSELTLIPDDDPEQIDSLDLDAISDPFGPESTQGATAQQADASNPSPAELEKLRMRKWVVAGILDSEHDYVDNLRVLNEYSKSLESAAKGSQPVISLEDVQTIFSRISDLHAIHAKFVADLEPVVHHWNPNSEVGPIFKEQAVFLNVSADYVKNYQKAVATFHRCCQESEQFRELTKSMKLKPNSREVYTLEDLLHKPVVRFQRNTLVLHDLLKSTPVGHPDHMWLQKAQKLTQFSLESLGSDIMSTQDHADNYLVRSSLIVEQVGNSRKLRHIFLFNNLLICAKQRASNKQKPSYEVKWYISLHDVALEGSEDQEVIIEKKPDKVLQEIDQLRTRVKGLKGELRREFNKAGPDGSLRQRNRSASNKSSIRNVERLKKKIAEQETSLVLAEPRLVFKLHNKYDNKTYRILLCSDYEKNEWRDVINTLQAKACTAENMLFSEAQQMLDSCKQLTKVVSVGTEVVREAMDEELMNGFLNVTIHKLDGLDSPCDTYACIEVDSFGHFYMKAKTNIVCNSTKPKWDQDFEVDLDGSNTLRIMCYKHTSSQDVLLGRSALELSLEWLKEKFQEKTINLNELSLTVSIRYTPRDKTLRKSMMRGKIKQGVFGIRINLVTKKENSKIPVIITSCIEDIERRGMDELGIYRVSGTTSEVQQLRTAFDKNSKTAATMLRDHDINAVTGVLKMYLRELPEALFTDSLYPNFADAYELVDPDVRKNSLVSLLQSLPEPNFSTVMCILEHLLRVSIMEAKNKMSKPNLATIFGPTLLRPATRANENASMDVLLSMETKDAMIQSGILLYFLQLLQDGYSFTRHKEQVTEF